MFDVHECNTNTCFQLDNNMSSKIIKNSVLTFFVNGKKIQDPNVDPEWTLLYYLRNKLRLFGTKLGCAEGGCGACTVMISKYNRRNNEIQHFAINACLAPICTIHGLAVTTVEGIGSTATRLHPVQERIAKAHGSQCGFCTPGIVMSMYTLLRNNPKPNMDDLDLAFQGNLCRCTGYRPILEGYKTFVEDWEKAQNSQMTNGINGVCGMGDKCCKNMKANCEEKLFEKSEFVPYDPTQEPIFPPELKLIDFDKHSLQFQGKEIQWYRPTTLEQLLDLKHNYPEAKLVVGNTELGVETKFKNMHYPVMIQTNYIQELTSITPGGSSIKVGASVTLQEMETALRLAMKTNPQSRTKIFAAIIDMLYYFASKQIRNVSAVGGNIMTSSPISDLNPIFLAANCTLEVQSKSGGIRKLQMDKNFFTGYRKNQVQATEVLVSIEIPFTAENQYFYAFKQARRRDDDIAIVNMAIDVFLEEKSSSKVISDVRVAFGGMAPTTVLAQGVQKALIGQTWDDKMLEVAYEHLIKDLPLAPGAPGGMINYRRSLTLSLFFRAYLAICQQLNMDLPEGYLSGIDGFHHKAPKSSQYFAIKQNETDTDKVGHPVPMLSAFKQASGEAFYVDDLPPRDGELYMALVFSTKAHAEILSIDPSEALKIPGVKAFFCGKDIDPHVNHMGPIIHDEQIFTTGKTISHGQVLGCVIAEDQRTAQKAAKKVKIQYKDLSPIIISIEDAIKHNSYYPNCPKKVEFGNVDEAFKNADHVVEGTCRTGGQEHFYLETHAVLAVPKIEDNEMEIFASTQNPAEIAHLVAHMLQLPTNRVVCRTKRLGGGFGGKESRGLLVSLPAAFAAHKLKKPIRCMLDRDEDMLITGTRHPFFMKYKACFNKDGKITGCEVYLYNNAGYSTDLSFAVLQRAMFHFQNSYNIPNVRVFGYVCKTNLPSNTAFRGFGGPQGMLCAEYIVRDIAEKLGRTPEEISRLNLYQDGDLTHYNQKFEYCTLRRCWDECFDRSNFEVRKKQVEAFNKQNRWKKRGISMVPTTFGIAFTEKFLNQTGAFVIVYIDGSVLLSHGGVEMGQGLHTKMIQVASKVLGCPMENIHISETATDKVPNTSPTAASVSSDLNGMAIMNACNVIVERLKPFKEKNPKGTWKDWVKAAYFGCVSLSATGYYAIPELNYNSETNTGKCFNYFTFGVACSEIEIDCLTGDHQVLRTDIVMDLGESLNPAIDVGQVEGAFMQGYGLYCLEETVYLNNGAVFTRGPGAYKIPGFGNIPVEFNVSLLKGAPNPRAVFSSKAVGEPPLFLASSIFFAIREAINSARTDAGINEPYRLYAPATSANIRMGCVDHLTKKFNEPKEGTFTPWNVIP